MSRMNEVGLEQRRHMRGVCGVCGLYKREIEMEFAGGLYYQTVCDECWYKAHPGHTEYSRRDRNVRIEFWNKTVYEAIYTKHKAEYVTGDNDFLDLVRESVTNHWNSIKGVNYNVSTKGKTPVVDTQCNCLMGSKHNISIHGTSPEWDDNHYWVKESK